MYCTYQIVTIILCLYPAVVLILLLPIPALLGQNYEWEKLRTGQRFACTLASPVLSFAVYAVVLI